GSQRCAAYRSQRLRSALRRKQFGPEAGAHDIALLPFFKTTSPISRSPRDAPHALTSSQKTTARRIARGQCILLSFQLLHSSDHTCQRKCCHGPPVSFFC